MENEEKLNEEYIVLTDPRNIIEFLGTEDKFRYWISEGTIEDLEMTLECFEEYELYEHCAIIKEQIELKEYDKFLNVAYRNEFD